MTGEIRVSGVVAALSVTSDLARGHPPGEAQRACLLATELARRAGLEEPDRRDVYYTALMRFAGCPATSHEIAARYGGDDVREDPRITVTNARNSFTGVKRSLFLASPGWEFRQAEARAIPALSWAARPVFLRQAHPKM